jgi:uncharacterized coiled-coil DUF342 family protein
MIEEFISDLSRKIENSDAKYNAKYKDLEKFYHVVHDHVGRCNEEIIKLKKEFNELKKEFNELKKEFNELKKDNNHQELVNYLKQIHKVLMMHYFLWGFYLIIVKYLKPFTRIFSE